MTKKIKTNCKCVNCGNEADMEVTCSLSEYETAVDKKKQETAKNTEVKVKGTGTCINCGNEADMWIDI